MLDERFVRSRLTIVGKIRAGLAPGAEGNPNKKGPRRLETLRFTSAAGHLIEAIAEKYGGTPQEWRHPTQGQQMEVVTKVSQIPVYIPKQVIEPWFELWASKNGKASRQRRCTGSREVGRNAACLCDPDGVMERDDPRRACSPVIRMMVLLADVPGANGWGIESHGWNAIDEWSRNGHLIDRMPDSGLWPARLMLEKRSSSAVTDKGMEAKEYVVPVVLFDVVTARQLQSGAAALGELLGGPTAPAVSAGEQRQAIAATAEAPERNEVPRRAPAAAQQVAPRPVDGEVAAHFMERIAGATRDDMAGLKDAIKVAGLGDTVVGQAWIARRDFLRQQAAEEKAPRAEDERRDEAPPDDVVDAVVIDDQPTPPPPAIDTTRIEELYNAIFVVAGANWTTSQLNAAIALHAGVASVRDAGEKQLAAFLADLKAGKVEP